MMPAMALTICFRRATSGELPILDCRLSIRDPETGKCDFSILNRQSSIDNHSYRSATMGSTFAARRAGTSMAKQATSTNTMGTAMNVKGSKLPTP